jgi:hypothetical protein
MAASSDFNILFLLNEDNFIIFTIIGPAKRISPSIMFETISGILESWYDSLIEFSEVDLGWAFRLSILKKINVL